MGLLNSNYICAVDVSSSKIAAVAAKVSKGNITDIFFETTPSKGIKKGLIFDSVEFISSLEGALKKLKNKSKINIRYVYVNISGQDIITRHSQAVIPLAERGNKVITRFDIEKVNEQARILGSSLEEEIIEQIPYSYTVDSKNDFSKPIGLYSHRLGVDLYLICCKLSTLQTFTRSINQAGYEIKDLFFSGLATGTALFDENLKKGLTLLCDIGSDITEIMVFKDSLLKQVIVLTLGGDNISEGLSEALKIPFDLADEVKKSYAAITEAININEDKEILIKKDNLYKPIKQRLVMDTATFQAKAICQYLKENIEKNLALGEVNNFIVCGRTVLLEGFLEMLETNLGIPVKLGRLMNPKIISFTAAKEALSGQKYLTFVSALGIIARVLDNEQFNIVSAANSSRNSLLRMVDKFKEVYQEYF